MQFAHYDLPKLPPAKLLAWDDASTVHGYSADQMKAYAVLAMKEYEDRLNTQGTLRSWLRGWLA